MKKIIYLAIISFTLSCCSKSDNPIITPPTPTDQLPPATTTGTNKVGCLVNGQVFLPHQNNPFGSPAVTCYYQYLNGGYEFGLGFSNDQHSPLRDVSIHTHKLQFVQGQTYNLTINQSVNSAYAFYLLAGGLQEGYQTNSQNVGEIKITKLDQINNIISGTFWFDAIKASNGEIVHITEGRFDMQYTP